MEREPEQPPLAGAFGEAVADIEERLPRPPPDATVYT